MIRGFCSPSLSMSSFSRSKKRGNPGHRLRKRLVHCSLREARVAKGVINLHEIESDIGDFLSQRPEEYDFIHMAHVIEHIPKYSLLWVVDAIFRALKKDGELLLRTPNMEGPTPNSSLYVTLAHEYGFSGSNLKSLLDNCGFDDITFRNLPQHRTTLKQRLGGLLRSASGAEPAPTSALRSKPRRAGWDRTDRDRKKGPLFDRE